jgi:hypothetical protein
VPIVEQLCFPNCWRILHDACLDHTNRVCSGHDRTSPPEQALCSSTCLLDQGGVSASSSAETSLRRGAEQTGGNWRVFLSDVRSPLACGAEQINGGHVRIPPLCGSTDSRFVTAYAQAALHLPESWTTLAFSTILRKTSLRSVLSN